MSKFSKITLNNNEKGYTLVLVLMIIMVFSVIGISIMATSMNSVKMSAGEREDQSVYYIAEAGLSTIMNCIEMNLDVVYENTEDEGSFFDEIGKVCDKHPIIFEKTAGLKPDVQVSVEELDKNNPRNFKITSEGALNNKNRVVEQEFSIPWVSESTNLLLDMAVVVKQDIKLPNGTIVGNIGSHKKGPNSITVSGGGSVIGNIYVPKNHEHHAINKPSWMNNFPMSTPLEMSGFYELPLFPDFPNLSLAPNSSYNEVSVINGNLAVRVDGNNNPKDHTYDLTSSRRFNEIKITNKEDLYFNLGNNEENREIVVDHLNLANGMIHIIGKGKLTIYVKGDITLGSGSIINMGKDRSKLDIFLKGAESNKNPKNFTLSGSQKVYGSLYAEDANINITSGGGFDGNIFTGGTSFKVSGGTWTTSPLILAPNALFEHSNGTINGVILTHTYEMSGGAKLNQDEIEIKVGPISPGGIPKKGETVDLKIDKKLLIEK